MNNPMGMIMQLANMARGGQNPMGMLQQMAANNPQAQAAMNIVGGKNPQQLYQIASNMAKERGCSAEDLARQLGLM